jgi:hypothetical protein
MSLRISLHLSGGGLCPGLHPGLGFLTTQLIALHPSFMVTGLVTQTISVLSKITRRIPKGISPLGKITQGVTSCPTTYATQ